MNNSPNSASPTSNADATQTESSESRMDWRPVLPKRPTTSPGAQKGLATHLRRVAYL